MADSEKIKALLRQKRALDQDKRVFRYPHLDPNSKGDIGIEKSGDKQPSFLPPMSGPPDRDPAVNPFRNAPVPESKRLKQLKHPIQDT
jgi:hypothetical protein